MLTLLLVYALLLVVWSAVPRYVAARSAAAVEREHESAGESAPARRRVPAVAAAATALWR